MSTSLLNALFIVPILAFLILVHELGHYMAARKAGMRVEEFGFGLPPRIWGKQRGDTIWSINAIPFGGFVRVLGEDGKNTEGESMQSKSAGQRALFITAGSIMNFLTAFVLIAVLIGAHGQPSATAVIAAVVPDSPAATAGWQPGDQFVEVEGKRVNGAVEVIDRANDHLGEEITVIISRDGELVTTQITPRENPPEGQGPTGIRIVNTFDSPLRFAEVESGSAIEAAGIQAGDKIVSIGGTPVPNIVAYDKAITGNAGQATEFELLRGSETLKVTVDIPAGDNPDPGAVLAQDVVFERVGIVRLIPETVRYFFSTLQRMGEGLIMLITGEVSVRDMAGPIGMGQLTSEVLTESASPTWVTLANITILLSLNLAVLNLLPLPALDGGRLVFVILEVLRRGKRVAPEKEGMVHFIGLVVLLGLMFAIAFVDIDRIVSGDSLLQ